MTGIVEISVVDVGQGQCTFVEIYDKTTSDKKLKHTLLFDCGSDKKSTYTEVNIDYIAKKINGMTTPAIDCIVFSHGDKDHIILTFYLLSKLTGKPPVGAVWYGGDREKYTKKDKKHPKGRNIINHLVSAGYCTEAEVGTTGSNYTGYDEASGKFNRYFWKSPDKKVTVYPVVSNALSTDPDWDDNDITIPTKTAEEKNRVSIICQLNYDGATYLICGDATNKTMGAVNTLFTAGTTVFDNNKMTTIPHHGSRSTGFAVKSGAKASDEAVAVVNTFATLLKSKTLTASAFEKHRHPSLQLLSSFIPTTTTPIIRDPRLKQKNSHRITAYLDISVGKKSGIKLFERAVYTFESLTNTFTTRYWDGTTTFSYELGDGNEASKSEGLVPTATTPINDFACWQYETHPNGQFYLGGYPNLAIPLVLFTGGATAISAKSLPEDPIVIPAAVTIRKKAEAGTLFQPAHIAPQFRQRLNQFR
jgi:hypothetical protein